MDKYLKFLKRLNKFDRSKLLDLIEKIIAGDLKNMSPKKLRGFKDLYRVRVGKIRIAFQKIKNSNIIINIDYGKRIYKNT
ncbi:MAG: hypothetical protein ABH856_04690 [Patescibacteria group bacterium]